MREPSWASTRAASASPPALDLGSRDSTISPSPSGASPTRWKKSGSSSSTLATIADTTPTLSVGASPVRIMRWSRWSTIPDMVWTIDVKAATGIT